MAYFVIPAHLGKILRLDFPETVEILRRKSHPLKHPSRRGRISPHEVNAVLYEMGLQVPHTPLNTTRRAALWIPTEEAKGLYDSYSLRIAWDIEKIPTMINEYLVKKENSSNVYQN